ncbi:hypothetical protein HOG48_03015 [Candidatus Peregrinibacteria bacterium]|jgi:hypothetical protein|nr:hypothetical protein [Candidatus Peregrinibacteria bacterium]
MKNKKVLWIALALIAALVLGMVVFGGGADSEDMEGKLKGKLMKKPTVHKTSMNANATYKWADAPEDSFVSGFLGDIGESNAVTRDCPNGKMIVEIATKVRNIAGKKAITGLKLYCADFHLGPLSRVNNVTNVIWGENPGNTIVSYNNGHILTGLKGYHTTAGKEFLKKLVLRKVELVGDAYIKSVTFSRSWLTAVESLSITTNANESRYCTGNSESSLSSPTYEIDVLTGVDVRTVNWSGNDVVSGLALRCNKYERVEN